MNPARGPSVWSYLFVVALTLLATLARALLDPWLGNDAPFSTFYLAVIVAAWRWGRGPALLALLIGGFLADFFFIPPRWDLGLYEWHHVAQMCSFVTVGLAFAFTSGAMRSARARAEGAARQTETQRAYLDAVLRQLPAGVVIAEAPSGRILLASQAVERLVGEPLFAENIADYGRYLGFHSDGRPYPSHEWPLARTVVFGEVVIAEEITFLRPDDSRVTFSAYSAPVRDERGCVIAAVLVFFDISERKQLQANLQVQAEHLAADARLKDEFLAALGHELRNPLSALSNVIEVLRLGGHVAPPLPVATDRMRRQLDHLGRLVDDLTEASRVSQGKIRLQREHVDLADVVMAAVEMVRPTIDARRQELTVSLPQESVLLDADRVRLTQVVSNVLHNAAKYTPDGGRIFLRAARDGAEVDLRVQDTGKGIPAELLPRIFDLFVQGEQSLGRPEGGLGIGLTLVKRLVELHGGRVSAASEGPGCGSLFVIRLPVGISFPVPRLPCAPSENRRRVLLVEDDPDAADDLAGLLKHLGHIVRTAHDGEEALAAALAFRPDVVLTDIGLPGMNGWELARRLRELPGMEVLLLAAVTGYTGDADGRESHEMAMDHLVKPVHLQELRDWFSRNSPNVL